MHPIDPTAIRGAFVNASRSEVSSLTLPAWFDEAPWEQLEFLGWRDPKFARRAYAVIPLTDDELVAVLLQRTERTPAKRAQCSWCRDVRLPNDVVLYGARRAGPAGRKGDSVGTLVCEDFECSRNARTDFPRPYDGYDQLAARLDRIAALRERVTGFARTVREGA